MATLVLDFKTTLDAAALSAIVEMARHGLGGAEVPPVPKRIVVLGRTQKSGGSLTVPIAPSPEFLRWLAAVVEANPTFAAPAA